MIKSAFDFDTHDMIHSMYYNVSLTGKKGDYWSGSCESNS